MSRKYEGLIVLNIKGVESSVDELIAADADAYVRIATRLVQEAPWRAALTLSIRARKQALYQDESCVAALTQFLRSVQPPACAAS